MIQNVIEHRKKSIGSMEVRRVLPYAKRRSVGPFVFVDDFGPVEIVNDQSMDVLPHPHIGIATVSYLFEGHMTHRDSIGSVQRIRPGELNWMTAGSGIVHSERLSDSGNRPGGNLAGLQTWVALPSNMEESEPAFFHHRSDDLPLIDAGGVSVKLLLGSFGGAASPVETLGAPFYAECRSNRGDLFELKANGEERAVYGISGQLSIDGQTFQGGQLILLKEDANAVIKSTTDSVFMILGGPPLEKPRFMYWNFVSSSKDRIESAKSDWNEDRFDSIPNETGRIPAPKF